MSTSLKSFRPLRTFLLKLILGLSAFALLGLISHQIYFNHKKQDLENERRLRSIKMIEEDYLSEYALKKLIDQIGTTNFHFHKVLDAKLAIVTVASDPGTKLFKLSIKNKLKYAKHMAYSLMVRRPHLTDRNPAWSKMGAILEAFDSGYPLVWMLDLDTIITNMSIPLHRFPDPFIKEQPETSVFVSKDCNGLNTGSFLLRNTPWSRYFLNKLIASFHEFKLQDHIWCEQQGFILNYNLNASWSNYVLEVPEIFLNLYPNYCRNIRNWKPGDFLLHFAGIMHRTDNLQLYVHHFHKTTQLSRLIDPSFNEDRYVEMLTLWNKFRKYYDM